MKSSMQSVTNKLKTYQQNRQLQRAIDRAYAAFSRQYPRWANSLFDIHFLRHQAALTLNWQFPLEPTALAEAYLEMIGDQKMVQPHHRARVLSVAHTFIQLVTAELQSQRKKSYV